MLGLLPRLPGGHEDDLFEVVHGGHLARRHQVTVVDRVEGAAHDAQTWAGSSHRRGGRESVPVADAAERERHEQEQAEDGQREDREGGRGDRQVRRLLGGLGDQRCDHFSSSPASDGCSGPDRGTARLPSSLHGYAGAPRNNTAAQCGTGYTKGATAHGPPTGGQSTRLGGSTRGRTSTSTERSRTHVRRGGGSAALRRAAA